MASCILPAGAARPPHLMAGSPPFPSGRWDEAARAPGARREERARGGGGAQPQGEGGGPAARGSTGPRSCGFRLRFQVPPCPGPSPGTGSRRDTARGPRPAAAWLGGFAPRPPFCGGTRPRPLPRASAARKWRGWAAASEALVVVLSGPWGELRLGLLPGVVEG